MTNATYTVTVDMNASRSESLTDDTDVTADVIGIGDGSLLFAVERGHDQTRILTPLLAGAGQMLLDNRAGTYNVGSNLKAGKHVRYKATFSGTDYELFNGYCDHPVQSPHDNSFRYVILGVLGNLARLVGRKLSTALYADITTSDAIQYLLDAAAYPANTPRYLDALGPVGGWNLDSTSGDDPDTSGNGNDAVITLGSGVRGSTAIDDDGVWTTEFDGASTRYSVTADAAFNNFFATGGLIFLEFVADSDGETDQGVLVDKGIFQFNVTEQSGSTMRLHFWHEYAGTDGDWETTNRVITVGTRYAVALYFDRSEGTAANPTMWLFDLDAGTYTELTVGSGLTENTSPTSTVSTDGAHNLTIGSDSIASRTFDGRIGVVRLFGDLGTTTYWTPVLKIAFSRAMTAPRHIDDGLTTMGWWWLDNEDAFTALDTLKNTEGPGAALYEDGTGAIVFKNRHARATESRSTVVQTTFDSGVGATEPALGMPFSYDPGIKDVVNSCQVEVKRREAQTLAVVWTLGEDITLGANETRQYIARQSSGDPFTAAVAPNAGAGDYTVLSGSVSSVTLDRTSGAQVTITIVAGASGAVLTGFQMRAQSVDVVNTAVRTNVLDASTSQDDYGVVEYRLNVRPEIDFNVAQDFCDAVVGYFQNGRPVTTAVVEGSVATARMTAALSRDVSDRVHVTVGSDIDADMFVEHIKHEVFAGGRHVTTFGLENAGDVAAYFILDTSELDSADVLAF